MERHMKDRIVLENAARSWTVSDRAETLIPKYISQYDTKKDWFIKKMTEFSKNDPTFYTAIKVHCDPEIQKMIDEGRSVVSFNAFSGKQGMVKLIAEWLYDLETNFPNDFQNLNRISFRQAFGKALEWKNDLQATLEDIDYAMPVDEHSPIVKELTKEENPRFSGWKWVWLRTPFAFEREAKILGSRFLDRAHWTEGYVASLRDPEGHPRYIGIVTPLETHVYDPLKRRRGKRITDAMIADFERFARPNVLLSNPLGTQLPDGLNEKNNIKLQIKNGVLHCDNGPAIQHGSIFSEWCQNGLAHKDDGPARVCLDGRKYWFQNGQLHREDGPAIVFEKLEPDWRKKINEPISILLSLRGESYHECFYINNKELTEEEFRNWQKENLPELVAP